MKIGRKLVLLAVAAVVGVSLMAGTALAQPTSQSSEEKFSSALERLVGRGVITQEQAKAVLVEITPLLQELPQGAGHGRLRPHRLGHRQLLGRIADALGLERKALLEQLREGKTLAEVIAAQGSTVDAVVEALSAPAKARLDKAVEAGRITAEQAERLLANFQAHARKVLENPGLHRGLARHSGPPGAPPQFAPAHGSQGGNRQAGFQGAPGPRVGQALGRQWDRHHGHR